MLRGDVTPEMPTALAEAASLGILYADERVGRRGTAPGTRPREASTLVVASLRRTASASPRRRCAAWRALVRAPTMTPMFHLGRGRRYRLHMRNASDDIHPVHLHRNSFELTRIAGKATGGVLKDVVMLGGYQEMEVDFSANNPGLTLFHCHQQLHMDFGFMALFDCA